MVRWSSWNGDRPWSWCALWLRSIFFVDSPHFFQCTNEGDWKSALLLCRDHIWTENWKKRLCGIKRGEEGICVSEVFCCKLWKWILKFCFETWKINFQRMEKPEEKIHCSDLWQSVRPDLAISRHLGSFFKFILKFSAIFIYLW